MPVFARSLILLYLFSPWTAAAVLENAHWRVEVEPATLAIRATASGQPTIQASSGVPGHGVQGLEADSSHMSWQWDDGAWTLRARLTGQELQLTVTAREPGELLVLKQPGSAMGRGLLWPMAEGHYIPRADRLWQGFMVAQGELDTTQDLSLPLWGSDHGDFSLHWLLTNPWNNRLQLTADGEALAVDLHHRFTALDPGAPMSLTLYLGDASPLSGARHYRQRLLDRGLHTSLDTRLAAIPQGRALLGAPHAYLWGNGLLGEKDVRNWPELLRILRSGRGLSGQLRGHLDGESRQLLDQVSATPTPPERKALLRGLNGALNSLARESWQGPAEPDMQVLAGRYGVLRQEVATAFAAALTPEPLAWGSGLSLRTVEALKAAGLPNLMLLLGEGWEGGLWHPEAVKAAVEAGYLLGPYDSYETALSAVENPDWTTAHLGQDAYERCAVIKMNGLPRAGFQQSGHYTDPRCVLPLMRKRVATIKAQAGFNAWFLDAIATGMLFDSYRPAAPMTQEQNAFGNAELVSWVSEQGLTTGSEDGNALTSRGILFAHGMQTPVLGWGDADMTRNTGSRYFVGRWYPPEAPAVFFHSVPLKEPYRTVHFAPQTRLPLYQSVFHGALITSHHWLFDSLKLNNVFEINELTQLLYNVAPLYHLNQDSLAQRLPIIAHQDAFFRPVHQHLANQALTDFRWLSDDRLVQQTGFEDGSVLLANFDSKSRSIAGGMLGGYTVRAVLADGRVSEYRSQPRRD